MNDFCMNRTLMECLRIPILIFTFGMIIYYLLLGPPVHAATVNDKLEPTQSYQRDCYVDKNDGSVWCTTEEWWYAPGGYKWFERTHPELYPVIEQFKPPKRVRI